MHGDVSEGAGMVGMGARFKGGAGEVTGSLGVNGGGGLLSLPNLMRRCSSYACVGVSERVGNGRLSLLKSEWSCSPRTIRRVFDGDG